MSDKVNGTAAGPSRQQASGEDKKGRQVPRWDYLNRLVSFGSRRKASAAHDPWGRRISDIACSWIRSRLEEEADSSCLAGGRVSLWGAQH